MRIFKIIIMSLVAVAFFSCEPTYTKTYSWAYPVAGDWMVKAYIDGAEVGGPYEIKSYNSSFGKDSVWFDDYGSSIFDIAKDKWVITSGNFWTMKYKAAVNMSTKTFSTTGSKSVIGGYEIGIKVLNGQIIGTDSISFDIQFEDDIDANGDPLPYGTTYQLKGHREVSYEEYMQQ